MDFLEVVTESKSAKKKQILIDLKASVDFVNAYKKGKTKAKSLKQLLNELWDYWHTSIWKRAQTAFKKHPSLKKDIVALGAELIANPKLGTPLGNDCFKIRMAIASKGRGKSGGSRVITHVKISTTSIFLLFIYDKSESDSISDEEIISRVKRLK